MVNEIVIFGAGLALGLAITNKIFGWLHEREIRSEIKKLQKEVKELREKIQEYDANLEDEEK